MISQYPYSLPLQGHETSGSATSSFSGFALEAHANFWAQLEIHLEKIINILPNSF